VCVCVFHSFFIIYIFSLGCFKPRGHQVVLELGGRGGRGECEHNVVLNLEGILLC
jgi:hypothetical protein